LGFGSVIPIRPPNWVRLTRAPEVSG
jgi:hypothetical protein